MAARHFEEVPVVVATEAALKKVQASNLTQLLNVFDGKDGIEQRWVKARPVINFLEVEGDGGKDTILTIQFSPFDQKLQMGWRSAEPNAKGKFSYCPSDELVTYLVHTWDIGLDESGNICRIEDPKGKVVSKPKAKRAGLPTA